jgi:phage N-6-adenine-methyltransferase
VNQSLFTSNSDQWDTPAHIVNAVRVLYGGWIYLDPCTSVYNPTDAIKFYTEGGLEKPWTGDVYMNPPYGREIGRWVRKASESYEAGLCSRVVCLLPARPDTVWWSVVSCYPVLFIKGRLKFGNSKNSAPFPSALIFMGFGRDVDIDNVFGRMYAPLFGWE